MRADDYPDFYREVFAKALKQKVELQFSSQANAHAFRKALYRFRYAVRDELPRRRKLYKKIMSVELSVQDTVLVLAQRGTRQLEKLNATTT